MKLNFLMSIADIGMSHETGALLCKLAMCAVGICLVAWIAWRTLLYYGEKREDETVEGDATHKVWFIDQILPAIIASRGGASCQFGYVVSPESEDGSEPPFIWLQGIVTPDSKYMGIRCHPGINWWLQKYADALTAAFNNAGWITNQAKDTEGKGPMDLLSENELAGKLPTAATA